MCNAQLHLHVSLPFGVWTLCVNVDVGVALIVGGPTHHCRCGLATRFCSSRRRAAGVVVDVDQKEGCVGDETQSLHAVLTFRCSSKCGLVTN